MSSGDYECMVAIPKDQYDNMTKSDSKPSENLSDVHSSNINKIDVAEGGKVYIAPGGETKHTDDAKASDETQRSSSRSSGSRLTAKSTTSQSRSKGRNGNPVPGSGGQGGENESDFDPVHPNTVKAVQQPLKIKRVEDVEMKEVPSTRQQLIPGDSSVVTNVSNLKQQSQKLERRQKQVLQEAEDVEMADLENQQRRSKKRHPSSAPVPPPSKKNTAVITTPHPGRSINPKGQKRVGIRQDPGSAKRSNRRLNRLEETFPSDWKDVIMSGEIDDAVRDEHMHLRTPQVKRLREPDATRAKKSQKARNVLEKRKRDSPDDHQQRTPRRAKVGPSPPTRLWRAVSEEAANEEEYSPPPAVEPPPPVVRKRGRVEDLTPQESESKKLRYKDEGLWWDIGQKRRRIPDSLPMPEKKRTKTVLHGYEMW